MKSEIIVALLGIVLASNVHAQDTYNIEAGVAYGSNSGDNNTSEKLVGVGGVYYFKPIVIDHSQPFAELDFLQKASAVGVRYENLTLEDNTFASTKVTPLEVSGKLYLNNFLFSASNTTWGSTNFKTKANISNYVGIKSNATSVGFGYFVLPQTVVSFFNSKETGTYSPSAGLSAINTLKVTSNGIESHTVKSLGGTQSLVFDLTYKQIKTQQDLSQTNSEYGLTTRYYPDAKYFFEGGYKTNSGDYAKDKGNTYAFGVGYEVNSRFGLFFSASKFTVSDSTQKTGITNALVTGSYRF